MHQEINDIGVIKKIPEYDPIHVELIEFIKDKNPVSGFLIMLSDEEFQKVRHAFNNNDEESIQFCSLFCIIVYLDGDIKLEQQFSFSGLNDTIKSMNGCVAVEQLRRLGALKVHTMDADNDKWTWVRTEEE